MLTEVAVDRTGLLTAIVSDDLKPRSSRWAEQLIRIFELRSGTQVAEFPVLWDAGGRRVAFSDDGRRLFVGCYYSHGLASYSCESGNQQWRRKDLKGVQHVEVSLQEDLVFCARESGACPLLKGDSGETAATFAGVRDVWFSRQAAFVLADSLVESHGLEVHHPLGVKVGQIVRAGFAVLDASFGEDTLLVVEAGSPIIRCMGLLDFEEKWRFPSNGKRWCFRSAYDKETRAFVTCHESNEGGYELLRFDSQAGSAQSVCKVAAQGSFSGSGGLFVDEGGNCWCARTGQRRKLF